jgi:hypothetical protein
MTKPRGIMWNRLKNVLVCSDGASGRTRRRAKDSVDVGRPKEGPSDVTRPRGFLLWNEAH